MKTIITTAGRPSVESIARAKLIATDLQVPFVERRKRSIAYLHREYNADVLVVSVEKLALYQMGITEPFFFHPNSAAYRLKRLLKGDSDPLIEAAQLQLGDSFLDCTLGLGSDSIIASYQVGEEGNVYGIEGNAQVAYIVKKGLQHFPTDHRTLKESMERIHVIHAEAINFLKTAETNSWDIVYMDPMFQQPVNESINFSPLRQIGLQQRLSKEWMEEACRVAKRRIVVKDHYTSTIFKTYGMTQLTRPNIKFHFGYIDK